MRKHASTLSSAWALILCTLLITASASSVARKPLKTVYAVRNATIHTYTNRVHALSKFDISFVLNDADYVKLVLEPNHDIFHEAAVVNYLGSDGQVISQRPLDRMHHKVFKGKAWTRSEGQREWIAAGWARVMVKEDGPTPLFDGSYSVDWDTHHIHLAENYLQTRHVEDPDLDHLSHQGMVVYRDSDIHTRDDLVPRSLSQQEPTCLADDLDFNVSPDHPIHQSYTEQAFWGAASISSLFGKRQIDSQSQGNSAGVSLVTTIGQSNGCPTTRKVALVGVAADCNYRASFSSDNETSSNIISQMNQASEPWERAFKISLAVQSINLFNASCPGTVQSATPFNRPCSDASYDITDRLNDFSRYRATFNDNNSHWTLFSTCASGSAVGLAWLGQACKNAASTSNSSFTGNGDAPGSQTVSGANVIVRTRGAQEWQIIAHETGHTFGAVHDCTSQACANQTYVSQSQCCPYSTNACDASGGYIMNPSAVSGVSDFSPCSVGNVCSALLHNTVRSSCLSDNKGVTTITGPQCGNGIVEAGEDCDPSGRDNACCDAATCKFKSGAVCDDSNEDCCHSCKFATNGTICRASTGVCDPQEVCTGSSPTCPSDVNLPNGQDCGNGLQCASGQCTSRDNQCRMAMNISSACGAPYDSRCQISCQGPSNYGQTVCYTLPQNFVDGTSCGGSGRCSNGQCNGDSTGAQIRNWIQRHKNVVIGVAVGVGVLLILIILCCVVSCCRKRKIKKTAPPRPPAGWQGWQGGPPPPNMSSHPNHGGGFNYGPPQPPQMSGGGGGPGVPPPTWRGGSARYA